MARRRASILGRQSSINTIDSTIDSQTSKQSSTTKVLIFNGHCSEVFRSAIEDSVEDCIVEFPGQTTIYVSKPGHVTPLPPGSRSNSIVSSSHIRSQRRQSNAQSTHPPSIRQRHPFVHQKFSVTEQISEEKSSADEPTLTEIEVKPEEHRPMSSEEPFRSAPSRFDSLSQSISSIRPKSRPYSHVDREKNFRLSDLVMLGPEHFSNAFHLSRPSRPRRSTTSKQRSATQDAHHRLVEEKYNQLDDIKQDLFHRYLWTQKPQVSCRIRPMASYSRSSTFVV